ncbi:hypothetical protein FSP39_010191 [Pinctada imbricata]|uniref:Reverse transcriptase domain-containing protein n=1 Tax=Pinctada imbricata TaxID=66713 RepID=A0AA88XR82_PINIB|nr:hypothetical protein FSP39_010191 [Pinctada imbricata]
MDNSNISWHCIQCGMPNFTTSFFSSANFETSNSFVSLTDTDIIDCSHLTNPGTPQASSSPNPNRHNTTNKNTNHKADHPPLKVLNINFQSLKNKKTDLLEIIDTVKPDIILGTETWLNSSISSYDYFPPDLYNVYRNDRVSGPKHTSHGGVLIAITKDLISSEVKELQSDCEIIWAEINTAGSRNILISSYYRPPSDTGQSLEQLEISLSRINHQSNSTILLGGDFNLGHIDWPNLCTIPSKPDASQHQMLLNIINDNHLHQTVNIPTRKDRILDLLLVNNPTFVTKITTLPPIGSSDHDIVYAEIDTWLKRVKGPPRKVLKYNKANWDGIRSDLEKTYTEIKNQYPTHNINQLWNIFKTNLTNSINTYIPSKLIRCKHRLPWVTDKLRRMINKKNKLYKKKKDPNYTDKYKKLKSHLQKCLRQAYWDYIEKIICELPTNDPDTPPTNQSKPKKLYQYIKSIRTDKTGISTLKKEGITITDTKEKANILNEQFLSVFTHEPDDDIPDKGTSTYPDISDIHFTTPSIEKLLNNINPHKATGPDNISGHVLKQMKTEIAQILTLLFKKSYTTETIPVDWKHANVAPVYKKGDTNKAVNYRPISLTCISCKLMEHVVTSQIMKHLESNNILYDLQHGFRHSRSCETQLLSFVQELHSTNNSNTQSDLIIMDFAKAFDKVPHRRLLYKLNYYGISGHTQNWIASFLSDRTQTVVLDGLTSNTVPVTSGVPQGTVLGPVLFLVYINDLPDYLSYSKLRLFADDSIIYMPISSAHDCLKLQTDLDAAARWERDWLMAFHPDKCTVLSVTTKRKPIKHNYTLHNHTLEPVSSSKYLGITLQSNLKWDNHIHDITAKANKTLGFLKRNLKTANQNIKDQAYRALVRPKLEYASSVWDPHTKESASKLEMIQRRGARYVCNRYHNTSSVTEMIDTLDWPPLTHRRLRTRLIMMYKITHALVAIPSNTILIPPDTRTRKQHTHTFRHIQTSKDSYRYSFFPYTITQWNQLPAPVILSPSVDIFREQLTPAVLCTLL